MYQSFVLNCPVKDTSRRAHTFEDLGWKGSPAFRHLMTQMHERTHFDKRNWDCLEGGSLELGKELKARYLLETYSFEKEFFCYCKAGKGKVEGLFYLVRNAFAHGSFSYHESKGEGWFALETRKSGKLRGRAFVRVSTLRTWRKLLDEGYPPKQ